MCPSVGAEDSIGPSRDRITFHSSPDKALEVVRAIEAEGVKGLAIQADAGDAEAVQQVVTDLGRIDMLVNAAWVQFPGVSVYALTNAALVGFTHALARELGPRGITVNNIEPGPVDIDMNPSDGKFTPFVKPTIAIGRYGTTDEIAGLVSYLAGPDSAYVKGASIRIDGGASA